MIAIIAYTICVLSVAVSVGWIIIESILRAVEKDRRFKQCDVCGRYVKKTFKYDGNEVCAECFDMLHFFDVYDGAEDIDNSVNK